MLLAEGVKLKTGLILLFCSLVGHEASK